MRLFSLTALPRGVPASLGLRLMANLARTPVLIWVGQAIPANTNGEAICLAVRLDVVGGEGFEPPTPTMSR